MLRRYSSRGVDTVHIESRKTIGRQNCDINVEGAGVFSPHVAIELHPFTRTYWLRELSLTGSTTVNDRHVNGQMELHSGDLIRLGNAQPLVFEDGSMFPVRKISPEIRSISTTLGSAPHNGILPILGHRMEPIQASHRSLSGSRNNSALKSLRPKRTVHASSFRDKRLNATAVTPNPFDSKSSGASIDSNSEVSPRGPNNNSAHNSTSSVGNSLLQRVVRLQSEVARKDEEILSLLYRLRTFEEQLPDKSKRSSVFLDSKRSSTGLITPLNFELEVYRCFIHVMTEKLHKFNEIVIRHSHKGYGDIFLKFTRSMEEPFTVKMTEIEEECQKKLHEKGFDDIQMSKLRPFLLDDQKEHISNLAQEIETIFPVIKDATSIAKESISVCQVFTQWSRHLGDNLRTYGLKSSLLNHAIDCLKEQFAVSEMSKHWLPPSVAPLFRLIALDVEKRESKKDKDTQTDGPEDIGLLSQPKEEHVRLKRAAIVKSVTSDEEDLDQLISRAEEKTMQLQKDIDSLSTTIRREMEMDKATEHHLEELCSILVSIGSTLQHFAEQNVEVKHKDIQDGIQQLDRQDISKIMSPEKSRVNTCEPTETKNHNEIRQEALESLRAHLFSQLGTEPSLPSAETVSISKDILEDLIFIAQQFSQRLESPKGEDSLELEDDDEEIIEKVMVEGAHAIENGHLEYPPNGTLFNIEEGDEEEHTKEIITSNDSTKEEEEHIAKRKISVGDEVFLKEEQKVTTEEAQQHHLSNEAQMERNESIQDEEKHSIQGNSSRKASVTDFSVISSEEYVKHGEEITSPRACTYEEKEGQTIECHGEETNEPNVGECGGNNDKTLDGNEHIAGRTDEAEKERESHNQTDEVGYSTLQQPGADQHPHNEENSAEPDLNVEEGYRIMNIPIITEIPMTPVDNIPFLPAEGPTPITRPKSARPRSSVSTHVGNGTVIMGNGTVNKGAPTQFLERKTTNEFFASPLPEPELSEGKEWTSEGNTEMSLSETTADIETPTTERQKLPETMTEEEKKLIERKANEGLADYILNSVKPKSICDIPHTAHIQSHINTATRHPVSYTKIPVKTFDFFNSPPMQKKKVNIEEKPPLRQPRMQFKL